RPLRSSESKFPRMPRPEIRLACRLPFLGWKSSRKSAFRSFVSAARATFAHNGLVGGSNPSSPTTHSRFLPTSGDAPKLPTNVGLFKCVLRISRSPEGHTADFGHQSLRRKIPFLAPKRCGAESFA